MRSFERGVGQAEKIIHVGADHWRSQGSRDITDGRKQLDYPGTLACIQDLKVALQCIQTSDLVKGCFNAPKSVVFSIFLLQISQL